MGVMGTGAWAEPVAADITLQQQVTHLTQRVERLEALMEGSRRRMLLGETAVIWTRWRTPTSWVGPGTTAGGQP